jgi:hypothetical protein
MQRLVELCHLVGRIPLLPFLKYAVRHSSDSAYSYACLERFSEFLGELVSAPSHLIEIQYCTSTFVLNGRPTEIKIRDVNGTHYTNNAATSAADIFSSANVREAFACAERFPLSNLSRCAIMRCKFRASYFFPQS